VQEHGFANVAETGDAALKHAACTGYGDMMLHRLKIASVLALLMAIAAPAGAADSTVPYWASIRANEVNMHVGPGEDYRINWVYHRHLLPLKVVRMMEGWRLVEDPDGARGWVLARFLMRERGAIVRGTASVEMHEKGDPASRLTWRLEPGVTGKLGDCDKGWCHLQIDQRSGYVVQAALWGAGEP
jgi:SH3-like domain-containing protein